MTDNLRGKEAGKRVGLGFSIGLVVLMLIVIGGAAVGVPRLLVLLNNPVAAEASGPVLDGDSFEALEAQRASEQEQLSSYGWVDEEAGLMHIPIEDAIAMVAESGLPVGVPDTGAPDAAEEPDADAASEVPDGAAIDFARDILPIFMEDCSNCHGDDDPEEGLVLTSYADVMAGSDYGSVVKPGDAEGSYLVELIESGQMPQRGDDLTAEEIALIVNWINAGAAEHATAESGTAESGTGESGTATVPDGEVAAADETVDLSNVSFQADVLPIFMASCAECHGDDHPEDELVLTSYADVMAGSVYGSVIVANDPEGSYLVDQVETGQMPKRGDDLTQAEIDIIVAWVNAGAPDN